MTDTVAKPYSPYLPLVLALIVLAINFWAWSLLSPLAGSYTTSLALNPAAIAFVLALPIIVGSLGRIPVGLLTDKYGGRLMLSLICFAGVVPVLGLTLVQTYTQLVVAAILLGLAGTSFAIGVPYINGWFPPHRRGLALGIYSMGNAGTAISGFSTPHLAQWWGQDTVFVFIAALLIVAGLVFFLLAKNAPGWAPPSKSSSVAPLLSALRQPQTWDMSFIYAITFGAFVTFAMYLPVLLGTLYQLSPVDAAARAGGFIVLATAARPIGGWLSDTFGGQRIILASLAAITVLAVIIAFQPILTLVTTVAFLSLAAILGCGSGAVIAFTSKITPAGTLGATVGIIGAIGGLGGFLPPIVLGAAYQLADSYTIAILLLGLASLTILCYSVWRFRSYSLS